MPGSVISSTRAVEVITQPVSAALTVSWATSAGRVSDTAAAGTTAMGAAPH